MQRETAQTATRFRKSSLSISVLVAAVLFSLGFASSASAQEAGGPTVSIGQVELLCNGAVYDLVVPVSASDPDGLAFIFATVRFADGNFLPVPGEALGGPPAFVTTVTYSSGSAPVEFDVTAEDVNGNATTVVVPVTQTCVTTGGSAPPEAEVLVTNPMCTLDGGYAADFALEATDDVGLASGEVLISFDVGTGVALGLVGLEGLVDSVTGTVNELNRPAAVGASVTDTDQNSVTVETLLPQGTFPCDPPPPPAPAPVAPPTAPPAAPAVSSPGEAATVNAPAINSTLVPDPEPVSYFDDFITITGDRYGESPDGDFGGAAVKSAPKSVEQTRAAGAGSAAQTQAAVAGGGGTAVAGVGGTASAGPNAQLAYTGSVSQTLALAGAALVAAGGLIALSGRRRTDV